MAALDYTFDSITLPTPNSLLAFCFCNVIIAILFLASSRSSYTDQDRDQDQDQETPSPQVKETCVTGDDDITTAAESEALGGEVAEEASASVDAAIIDCEDAGKNPEDEEEEWGPAEEEEEEEDDDELRRRVEEFIAKVNQGWKAEHSRR